MLYGMIKTSRSCKNPIVNSSIRCGKGHFKAILRGIGNNLCPFSMRLGCWHQMESMGQARASLILSNRTMELHLKTGQDGDSSIDSQLSITTCTLPMKFNLIYQITINMPITYDSMF